VADYRGLVNAAKAGRSRPRHLQLIGSIAVEGRKFRTCLGIPLGSTTALTALKRDFRSVQGADIPGARWYFSNVPTAALVGRRLADRPHGRWPVIALLRGLRHGRGMMVDNEPVLAVLYVSEAVARGE
jgi:hypothetical protein